MREVNPLWFAVAGALVIGVVAYAFLRRRDVGQGRFFADQTYHFQTLRVLNDVPSDGADTADVLETIKHIRSGDGEDLRRQPIEDRKQALKKLLGAPHPGIAFNRHFDLEGAVVFHHACKLGCEGIVSKRLGSPYTSGRSRDWVKVKNPAAPAVKREAEEEWR